MFNSLKQQLEEIPKLPRADLVERWRKSYGRLPPANSNRELLRLSLAHHLQSESIGRLPAAMKRQLNALAARHDSGNSRVSRASPKFKPGTRLVRLWGGDQHQITVLEQGFEYQGARFRSLSEIACRITGTRWSGPAFFGLRKAQGAEASHG